MAETKTLPAGAPAPDFTLPARSGRTVSLRDFRGRKNVLVFFYPKDDTPGCTKEACSLRDGWSRIQGAGIEVLGISRDGADSHNAFASKYNLPFELLTDADHSVHEAYGAWGEKTWPAPSIGVLRKSFLIGKDGNIRHVFSKVDVEHHAEEVLKAMESSNPPGSSQPPAPAAPAAPKPAAPAAPATPAPAAAPAAPAPKPPPPAPPRPAAPAAPAPKPPPPAPPRPAAPATPAAAKPAAPAAKKAAPSKKAAPKKKAAKRKKAAPKRKAAKKKAKKAARRPARKSRKTVKKARKAGKKRGGKKRRK
jgi:peroxiredoxin Q/BCP